MPSYWQPMCTAPRDGTDIVVIYSDLSGVQVVFWGVQEEAPFTNGWFSYEGDVGDTMRTDLQSEDDSLFAAWVVWPVRERVNLTGEPPC